MFDKFTVAKREFIELFLLFFYNKKVILMRIGLNPTLAASLKKVVGPFLATFWPF